MNIKFYLNKQRGVSLYLTLIILSLLLTIVLGISTILLGQMKIVRGMGDSVVAFYAADTGTEKVLYEDKLCRVDCPAPPPCPDPPEPCPSPPPCPCPGCKGYPSACQGLLDGYSISSSLENNSVYDAIFNTNDQVTIKSVGKYRGLRRAIEVIH